MEKLIVENLCEKYNRSEKFIRLLLKICEDNNILNKEEIVDEVCQKVCRKQSEKIRECPKVVRYKKYANLISNQ